MTGSIPANATSFSAFSKRLISHIFPRITDPVIKESGKQRSQRSISKRGDSALRSAIYQSTLAAVRGNPVISEFYHRKVDGGMPKKKALVSYYSSFPDDSFNVCSCKRTSSQYYVRQERNQHNATEWLL